MAEGVEPLPVTVISGFLGAGKTTLLNALLRLPAMAGTAVIINEFGETGIDHLLVDRVDGDMLMLTTGCLCCAARGDLIDALDNLLSRRRRGEVAFDRIVIETTGLADPGPVLNALLPGPGLGACRFECLVTVVDGIAGVDMLDAAPEAMRQVALADMIVLSKTDLLPIGDHDASDALNDRLHRLNPTASYCLAAEPETILATMGPFCPKLLPATDPHHHQAHLHGLAALTLRAGPVASRQFERFLDQVLVRHGAGLLRLKGILAFVDDPGRPTSVNVVQHRIHPAVRLEAWPDPDRGSRLVVIARSDVAEGIDALWTAFFGPPRIDQADAAALIGEDRPGLF